MQRYPRAGKTEKVKLGTTVLPETLSELKYIQMNHPDMARTPGEAIDFAVSFIPHDMLLAREMSKACARAIAAQKNLLDSLESEGASQLEIAHLERNIIRTVNLKKFYDSHSGAPLSERPNMRRLEMADGDYAIVPSQWNIFNESAAPISDTATVMEIRNGDEYDIPHTVIFTSGPLDKQLEKTVINTLSEIYPQILMVMKKEVEPALDEDGRILNMEEWKKSPKISFFPLMNSDFYLPGMDAPYGACIYRKS